MIKMIVAIANNNTIGNHGVMPWKIAEELQLFKQLTTGTSLLMGRKTVEHLPQKLVGRTVYALTRNNAISHIKHADFVINNQDQLQQLLAQFSASSKTLFIAGGKQIYDQFYHYADQIYVSRLKRDYPGDETLLLNLDQYCQLEQQQFHNFTFYKYHKCKGATHD